MDWYNSLESKGTLNWDGMDDLCQQAADQITCDSSTKRVTGMYSFFFPFSFFFFFQMHFFFLLLL